MQIQRFPVWAVGSRSAVITVGFLLLSNVPGRGETVTASAEDLAFFESQVRPLLANHCSECHSAEAGDPEGGLSFDSRADFFAAKGVAVAGKPDESLLVKVVR